MKAEIVGIAVALLIFVGTEESKLLDSYPLAKHSLDAVLLLVSLGLLFHGLKEPVAARVGRLLRPASPAKPAPQEADEWLTLADAARIASDHAHSTPFGHVIDGAWRKLSETEEDFLHMWAARVAAELAVPVYGTRIMSSRVQRIPLDDLQGAHFRKLATIADLGNSEPMNDFENLKVKRHDLEAGLAEITRARARGVTAAGAISQGAPAAPAIRVARGTPRRRT